MIDETSPIITRFDHLYKLISSERFLKKQGLGNEVPFFICPYRPEEDVEMKRLERQLIKQLDQHGVSILHINLYDLSIEMLKERGIWDRILNAEQNVVKEKFKELLQGVLDPENHLIPAIARKMERTNCYVHFRGG